MHNAQCKMHRSVARGDFLAMVFATAAVAAVATISDRASVAVSSSPPSEPKRTPCITCQETIRIYLISSCSDGTHLSFLAFSKSPIAKQ
jgi:hypothetical protein